MRRKDGVFLEALSHINLLFSDSAKSWELAYKIIQGNCCNVCMYSGCICSIMFILNPIIWAFFWEMDGHSSKILPFCNRSMIQWPPVVAE